MAFKKLKYSIFKKFKVSDGLQRVQTQPARRRLACSVTWAPPPRAPPATTPRVRAAIILQTPAPAEILPVRAIILQAPALALRTQALTPQVQVTIHPVQNTTQPALTVIRPDTTHPVQNTNHPAQTAACPVPATLQLDLT